MPDTSLTIYPASRRRWLAALVKLIIVAAVIWGVHRSVDRGLAQLAAEGWSLASLDPALLLLSMLLYIAGLVPPGLFWRRVLIVLRQHPPLLATLRAYCIGHLGKYVPGKALVVILRAGLIRGWGVSAAIGAVSVFYETLTMMSVGAFLAGAVLVAHYRDERLLVLAAVGMMAAAGLPTLPPVFRRLARMAGIGKADPAAVEQLAHLNYRTLLYGWMAMSASWLLLGLSTWTILLAGGHAGEGSRLADIMLCTAATALAVVAGFMSFVPGGAIVREAVMLELLEPRFGEGGALAAAVVARLAWLLAEVIAAGAFYCWRPGKDGSLRRIP